MKKGLLALLLFTGLFANKAMAQPCSLANLQISVYTGTDGKCYADVSFDMDRNNGNKFIYIELWTAANYSLVNKNRWQSGAGPLYADINGSSNTHPALATVAIDNTDYNNPVFSSYGYRPDPTVTVKTGTSVTTSSTPVSGSGPHAFYRYTVTHILLGNTVNGGCSNSNVSGIVWSTQANSQNSHIHCSIIGSAPARTLDLSGSADCGTKTYTLNINNSTNGSISGTYYIYADNGGTANDGVFDPNTDTQFDHGGISIGKNQSFSFSGTIPTAYAGYNLWAQVVLSDNTTQVVQLTTTPCPGSPNLTPIIEYLPSITHGTQTIGIVTTVANVSSVSTNGLITVYVARDPKYTINFNQTATTVGGKTVNNSVWTLNTSNPGFYIFTTSSVIAGGSYSRFGFDVTFNPNNSNGTTTITATIQPNSGGELSTDANDNTDSDVLVYFLK